MTNPDKASNPLYEKFILLQDTAVEITLRGGEIQTGRLYSYVRDGLGNDPMDIVAWRVIPQEIHPQSGLPGETPGLLVYQKDMLKVRFLCDQSTVFL